MLHITHSVEYPAELKTLYTKAIRYEWISFFYMISASFFTFLMMSNSQTMKTVWLEDLLGIIPPASFLVASKIARWRATKNFPYGFHKIIGIAYLSSSLALFLLGIFLFGDGIIVLAGQEHPIIPTVQLGDQTIWLGFLMILALLWSSIPSTILGHIKIPLAHRLYDKILYADSKMNKASWMSGFASIFGIIGIGLGYWWMDATVGILISLNIMNDGYVNLKQSLLDLIDEIPKTLECDKTEVLVSEVKQLVEKEEWIKAVNVRFRDDGHVFFGEVFIEPRIREINTSQIMALRKKIEAYNWRMHDIVIMPVD